MQMKKAGVVATGALATVAIMGAPAAAAPSTDASALTQATSTTEGKTSAMRQVGANQLKLARGGGFDNNGWDAPWDIDSAAVVGVLNGTVVNVAALQQCGSTSGNVVGISVPITSPNTVVSGFGHDDGYGHKNDIACANANVKITQTKHHPAILGAANDSVVNVASIQSCGSTDANLILGVTVPITSPNTVIGDCQNSNIEINNDDKWGDDDHWKESGRVEAMPLGQSLAMDKARQALVKKVGALKNRSAWAGRANARVAPQARGGGWDAPWDQDAVSLISALNGTAVQLITAQACGSTSPDVLSVAIPITSPNTVIGDCKNANVKISKDDPKGVIAIGDNTSLNVLPLQSCGSTSANVIAVAVPITSPNTVIGSCFNANTVID
jgi:hypothetical protein